MNYIDILNNKKVIENYNAIDKINPYPFNHGLKHVKNVCNNMDRLCDTLGIAGEEKEALLIAAALHDIGQVDGRVEHGRKSKEFLIANFSNELVTNKFYPDMLKAIEYHDHKCVVDYPLFTVMLQFCDKIDFTKKRLEDNYREKFREYGYEYIDRVEFIYDEEYFGIDIISEDVVNFDVLLFKEKFSRKIVNATEVLASKLERKPKILNNGKELKISISNYIILHGSFGSSTGNWFPWLRDELDKDFYKVEVPQMPVGVGNQNYENWEREFSKLNINENTIIIAHSIAPVFVCKYLINNKVKVKKLIFVCGFNNYLGIDTAYDAVNEPMYLDNLEEVKKYCDNIICFYSDNDPYVPFEVEKNFADTVANEQYIIPNGGHINSETGFVKFEAILEHIK